MDSLYTDDYAGERREKLVGESRRYGDVAPRPPSTYSISSFRQVPLYIIYLYILFPSQSHLPSPQQQ